MENEQSPSQALREVNEIKGVDVATNKQRLICVICLEAVSENAIARPCAHAFDFICLVHWLERTPTCPLCKTQVRDVEYNYKNQQDSKIYKVPEQPTTSPAGEASDLRSIHDEQFPRPRQPQSRRNPRDHGQASSTAMPTEDPLSHRRHIYRHQLYSLHVGSNHVSRFQELTPKRFRQDDELISRARKWIRRELQVFDYLRPCSENASHCASKAWWMGNPEYLLEWIIAMLKSVNIKGSSGQAEDMLQEFLGRNNARLFLHELRAWLRSPYSHLQDWDQNVQYNPAL